MVSTPAGAAMPSWQINTGNVDQLVTAWNYRTGDLAGATRLCCATRNSK